MEDKFIFPQGLTYDDILLIPGYTDFSRDAISLKTKISKKIEIDIPIVSSPMDTVTESELAIALAKMGGIGIIHRNLSVDNQAKEVSKVKKDPSASSGQALKVGAAIGVSDGYKDRLEALIKAGVDVIVLDSAHGWTNKFIEALKFIKKTYPKVDVIVGNIATYEAAENLCKNGADGLRVGMGPGAICTTRIVSGMGVPQVSAIRETVKAAKKYGVPVIADGGIKYSGDMIKALALGASTVMMGSYFAQSEEAPGKIYNLKRDEVPSRFQSIFDSHSNITFKFKSYRGMGSEAAMREGAKIKSEDEFHGKSYKDKVLVAEGVEGMVPVKGKVRELLDQSIGGIKSGMFYIGAKNISELQKKAKFIQVTHASLTESHPHGIIISNGGKSYQ